MRKSLRFFLAAILITFASREAQAARPIDEQLIEAVMTGDFQATRAALVKGANPNVVHEQTLEGDGPWVKKQHLAMWLLVDDGNPDYPWPPLEKRVQLFGLLIQAGLDMQSLDPYYKSTYFQKDAVLSPGPFRDLFFFYGVPLPDHHSKYTDLYSRSRDNPEAMKQLNVEIAAADGAIKATADLGPLDGDWLTHTEPLGTVNASSVLASKKDLYRVDNVSDGKMDTAWVEGSPWQGLGESIYVEVPADHTPAGMVIVSGYAKDQATFEKNSRPKRLKVLVEKHTVAYVDLADTREPQRFALSPAAIEANKPTKRKSYSVELRIVSVYPGTKYTDTCISEVRWLKAPAAK